MTPFIFLTRIKKKKKKKEKNLLESNRYATIYTRKTTFTCAKYFFKLIFIFNKYFKKISQPRYQESHSRSKS